MSSNCGGAMIQETPDIADDPQTTKLYAGTRKFLPGLVLAALAALALGQESKLAIALSGSTKNVTLVARETDAYGERPPPNQTEPFLNRWQRRFSSLKAKNRSGGFLFFKHIRKAGGTSLRAYFHDVLVYHNHSRKFRVYQDLFRNSSVLQGRNSIKKNYDVYYLEQEFETMDWQCPHVDPRWNDSLRVISLRHPIERQMSEFFYSGPGMMFRIERDKLYVNQTYTHKLAWLLQNKVLKWMKYDERGQRDFDGKNPQFHKLFGRFYVNNFLVRSLSGRAGELLDESEVTGPARDELTDRIYESLDSYKSPDPFCTIYFRRPFALHDPCGKERIKCPICDGPCFYPAAAWGEMGDADFNRALISLQNFDIVLLMETFNDADQSAFLNDVMGVPRDVNFSFAVQNVRNFKTMKEKKREKTHFYRDLLANLSRGVLDKLVEDNRLDIEFFERAIQVNAQMTNQWKIETNWNKNDFGHDHVN